MLRYIHSEGCIVCADEDEEDDGETDEGDATRYAGAASAATYWDALLRQHWEQLEKEEGAAQGRLGTPLVKKYLCPLTIPAYSLTCFVVI
jgi:hypothetical protein